ncbi:MAG: heme o synthase [Bacteroidetes bacterium]|jgi:heme o synthase|nr:MAG: protoheme IX farnesyltransferase [Cryomorphaceae bacterium BACL29 MAG-121220-bin8]MDA1018830.1 heme o synthase [Bacteroidota bacterium]|tara:strand:+ start:5098 stop:6012 length:915 start_codon:yes stop_codon:yes gene_type:complete
MTSSSLKTELRSNPVKEIFINFFELTKARLAISVVFSSIVGYLIASDSFDLSTVLLLTLGGYCMVGASNSFNQIIEKDIDKLMERTKNRPIPSGKMSVNTAFIISIILTLIGVIVLYKINPKTALFGSISIFIYTCLYTPLKTITPLSVFVGAIPGAIPFMLGWVAATNNFGIEPGTLFMIQFFWQFPHFWALGWMLHEDYGKAGINMLPTRKKDKSTALQVVLYTIWMIIISIFPVSGLTGDLRLSIVSAVVVLALGLGMLYFAINLYIKMSTSAAKKVFTSSIVYLTLLQITYLIDKIYIWI